MRAGFYHVPVDFAETNYGTLTVSTAGKPDVVIDLADLTWANDAGTEQSSILWHYVGAGLSGWCTAQDVTGAHRLLDHGRMNIAWALTDALETEATAQGWVNPTSFEVSFRRAGDPMGYRITYAEANCDLVWSSALGRALFGFSANTSGLVSHDSDRVPTHLIVPTIPWTSEDSADYEPDGIANHMLPDDNSAGYGVSRYVSPINREWVQQYETKAKTRRLSADAAHPWTFQHLFEYCREHGGVFGVGYYRLGNVHGGEVFALRGSGLRWHPDRASGKTDDTMFHIPFEVHVIGQVAES